MKTRSREDDIIVDNMIRLARHHRDNCYGEACNIMLSLILELFQKAGITLTREETQAFL